MAAAAGVSQAAWTKYESKRSPLDNYRRTFEKVAKALGVDVCDLFGCTRSET